MIHVSEALNYRCLRYARQELPEPIRDRIVGGLTFRRWGPLCAQDAGGSGFTLSTGRTNHGWIYNDR